MNTILGSAAGFSSGGPGKGMYCRAIMNMMARYSFVELASGLNHHFTDSGLWGIQASGPASHGRDLLLVLLQELHRFTEPVPKTELERAKNILKMNILMNLEPDLNRVEEIAKNYMTFGTLTHRDYINEIDKVTS